MILQINRLRLVVILLPLLFISMGVQSQTNTLENYIEQGLQNNLVLQQKNIDVKKAMHAIDYAKSLFLPNISFKAGYQTGAGGRSIALPVGDILNPVYSTLNQLTGSEKFHAINNVEQDFLAKNFYDAKITTAIPIVNVELRYNEKIENGKAELSMYSLEMYKVELIRNIKVAYYNYLSALKVVSIHENALGLANENLRINERLLQNGKGIPAYVLRAKSEQQQVQSSITEAKKAAENASLYFNFLLNRKNTDSIDVNFNLPKELDNAISLIALLPDVSNRLELKSLSKVIQLNNTVIAMNEKFWVPKLNGFVDIGSQSSQFNFNTKSAYYNVGLQLEIPLFHGKRNLIKIKQARLDQKNARLNFDLTSQQLTLSAITIQNNLVAAYQVYQSSLKTVESAISYQRLIERGFKEGINTLIEDIDGRNLLTTAQLQLNISLYNVLITAANLERETGTLKY